MRLKCKRRLEFDEELFFCFVDFKKVFDRLKWTKLFEVSKRTQLTGETFHELKQTSVVRTENEDSEPREIARGVRHGCFLSPLIFSIDAEMMMTEAMEDVEE